MSLNESVGTRAAARLPLFSNVLSAPAGPASGSPVVGVVVGIVVGIVVRVVVRIPIIGVRVRVIVRIDVGIFV
jgi:hypothetical protein